MRTIKFRAWNPVDEKMIQAHEMCQYETTSDKRGIRYGFDDKGCHFMMYEKHIISPVKDFHLMQYTGLKDKNGVEIYEGDILEWIDKGSNYPQVQTKREAVEIIHAFRTKPSMLFATQKYEVIGNIHEHPELLKEKKK